MVFYAKINLHHEHQQITSATIVLIKRTFYYYYSIDIFNFTKLLCFIQFNANGQD